MVAEYLTKIDSINVIDTAVKPLRSNNRRLTSDVKYWRDENAIHHVPKRALDEIILS